MLLKMHPQEIAMTITEARPFAVITGGSNGIGLELARQFLDAGHDILIAAQDRDHLDAAAAALASHKGTVTIHASDLSTENGVRSLYDALDGRDVDVLCLNAGIGLGGPFAETDLEHEFQLIDLNVRGTVHLTKLVLRDMVKRNTGKLLFTSSISASHVTPFEAVYGASKVFLRWFGEALRNELKDTDIGVTVLMPNATETDFFTRADMLDTRIGASDKDDPTMVAKAAFEALMADKHKVVPGAKNKILTGILDAAPAQVGAGFHRKLAEPGSADKG
ncbi:SDR family NAD(P)-dependent oxidoreductase [Falsirhodobacter sp. 1013]|uniref:SDR family NAD(P)-dependent oxidoreductase n=1 Tax=Falsirhodobacter sp. 1013 TaxID=3417566 RepID=UPI003EBA0C98